MNAVSETKVDARISASEARSDARLAAIEAKMDVQFAQLTGQIHRIEAEVHRHSAETIKWVAGIVISATVLGLTIMTFVVNNAIPKAAAVVPPVVIAIPAPPSPGDSRN